MIKKLLIISLVFLSYNSFAEDALPPAPEGYEWIRCGDDKMGLLKPEGWFHRTVKKGDTETHAVSLEDSKKDGIFETGLTLNIIKHVDKKKAAITSASEFIVNFIKNACRENEVLIDVFSKSGQGPIQSLGCRIRSQKKDDIAIVIHFFLIGNDNTGTVFLYQFEAPEKTWDNAWKTGDVLMKKIWIDDEI